MHANGDAVSVAYLSELSNYAVFSPQAFCSSVEKVRNAYSARVLAVADESLSAAAQAAGAVAATLIDDFEARLLEMRADSENQTDQHVSSAVAPMLERMERDAQRKGDLLGLPCGVRGVDLLTRGFQPGQMIIAGGRSGVGKSSLLVGATQAICESGVGVQLFSVEMSREEVLQRLTAAVSRVPFPRIRDAKWASSADIVAIREATERISKWPLWICDYSALSIEQLTAQARLSIRRHKVRFVGVDYVQLVSAQGKDERLRVSNVSRGLTRLAKSEQVAVMALSQLTRADRSARNQAPSMSDLRESGQLENDAHVVILLHRVWDEELSRLNSEGEIIVAKQRSGETGAIPAIYNRKTLLFEAEQQQDMPQQSKLYGYG